MQNKNNIKNWKIEITNEGAKLFITEGAVMARDCLLYTSKLFSILMEKRFMFGRL